VRGLHVTLLARRADISAAARLQPVNSRSVAWVATTSLSQAVAMPMPCVRFASDAALIALYDVHP
jgi:hypothetical protein